MKKAMETFKEAGIFDPGYFANNADATDGSGVITAMFNYRGDRITY